MLKITGRPRPDAPTVTAYAALVVVRVESELDDTFWMEAALTADDLRGLLAALPAADPGSVAGPVAAAERCRHLARFARQVAARTATEAWENLHLAFSDLARSLDDAAGEADAEVAGLRTTIGRLRAFLAATESDG